MTFMKSALSSWVVVGETNIYAMDTQTGDSWAWQYGVSKYNYEYSNEEYHTPQHSVTPRHL